MQKKFSNIVQFWVQIQATAENKLVLEKKVYSYNEKEGTNKKISN